MKRGIKFIQSKNLDSPTYVVRIKPSNLRECSECGLLSLSGMPGGLDATCQNCGYKDPCCYD